MRQTGRMSDSSGDWPDDEAVRAIERVIWDNGHMGDPCARIAGSIIMALSDAGYVIVHRDR